jgi:hypothetical protein
MIHDIQIQQLNSGFKFVLNNEEVEVSHIKYNRLTPKESIVSLHKTENYHIVGPYTAGFIINYLNATEQLHLLSLELIMTGKRLVEDLKLKKYSIGANTQLYRTGNGPMSLIDLGKTVNNCVDNKSYSEWFNKLKNG